MPVNSSSGLSSSSGVPSGNRAVEDFRNESRQVTCCKHIKKFAQTVFVYTCSGASIGIVLGGAFAYPNWSKAHQLHTAILEAHEAREEVPHFDINVFLLPLAMDRNENYSQAVYYVSAFPLLGAAGGALAGGVVGLSKIFNDVIFGS